MLFMIFKKMREGIHRKVINKEPGLYISLVFPVAFAFFVLAASGYLALVFNGPRPKYLISLLFGLGLGLAFDEFGMWLKLRDDEITRWSYDGFNIVIGFFFLLLSARGGIRLLLRLLKRRPSTLS